MAASKEKQLEKLFRGVMGETVHSAFRKGSDGVAASRVWDAIHVMPNNQWAQAINWMCWALAYSLKDE